MNITSFGRALHIEGSTIYRWFRDVLSDYAKDKSLMHKHDVGESNGKNIEVPILRSENFGEKLAIDEKHIGDDICTIFSNRETGKIAMLCKSIRYSDIKMVIEQNNHIFEKTQSITRDFSPLYEKVCTELIPHAMQIGDKFHAISNLLDAHQAVRVRYRQAELDKRRKAHQEFKKTEHERLIQSERSGDMFKPGRFHYKEEKLKHGETHLEMLARSRYLLYKFPGQWSEKQKKRAETLFETFPEIKQTYYLSNQFRSLMSSKNIGKHFLEIDKQLHQWYEDVEESGIDELMSFKSLVESNEQIISNYFISGETNAMAESVNSKIQRFITQNSGTRDKDFFFFRVGLYFA